MPKVTIKATVPNYRKASPLRNTQSASAQHGKVMGSMLDRGDPST